MGTLYPAFRGLRFYFRAQNSPIEFFPDDFGLLAEKFSVPIPDKGIIRGWFIPHPSSPNTLVLMHGFAMNKGDILKRTYPLAKICNLCYFDFLGSGESQGKTQIGFSEIDDIQHVINFLKEHKPQASRRIALYGLSQGAGAAVRYTANHPEIAFLIAEASYYSFWDVASRWIWNRTKTPFFPTVYGYLRLKEWKLHCRLDDLAPKNTAQRITVPTLLIHGEKDTISPVINSHKIMALLAGPKELWILPTAGHTSCAREAGPAYTQRIGNFIKEHF